MSTTLFSEETNDVKLILTGPYMLGVGLTTFLCSKEIYVMEHEFYTGLSILVMVVFAVKKFGPGLGNYLDKEIEVLYMFKLCPLFVFFCITNPKLPLLWKEII